MRYLIEPRESRYVKRYEFLSFQRNRGIHTTKSAKALSNKDAQKLADTCNRCIRNCRQKKNSKNS